MQVGDSYPVWWATGHRNAQGQPIATVLAVLRYTGRYPESFNAVLRLRAPDTRNGHLEMAVHLPLSGA